MNRKYRYLSSILLTAALAAPVAMLAVASPQDDNRHEQRERTRRYYDRQHKDYHRWDSNEDHAYSRWQAEHHEKRPFIKLSTRQKSIYWGWRHENPDHR